MAALSESAVRSIWQKAIKIYEEQRKAAATTSSTNFITLQAALIAVLSGDYVADMTQRVAGTRQKLTTVLGDAAAATEIIFRYYAQAINTPELDVQSAVTRVYDWFVANSYTIPSRLFVWASPSAGSNTGTGVIVRLNFDANGVPLENQASDTKTMICTADSSSGANRGEESFEFRGQTAPVDNLMFATNNVGSGKKTNISSLSAKASQTFIRNASFSQSTPSGATAVPTDITSWTSSITVNGTNYEVLGGTGVDGYYRDFPGDTTPLALRIKATAASLTQNLETLRSTFVQSVPYYISVAWRRKGTADGTLTLSLGGSSAAVDITTGVADAWNILKIGPGTANWFKNFDQAGLTLTIARSAGSTGNVDIDDCIISPYFNFDGSWYAVVGGATQFKINDSFTAADSEQGLAQATPQGVLAAWLYRTTGRYLPVRATAPLTACTAAMAGVGAGLVTSGTHSYKYSFVNANGESAPAAVSNTVTTDTAADGKVNLAAIVAGPTGTTARKIYRSAAGNAVTGPWLLLTTISDNSTLIYLDNIADGSLGTAAPAAVTISDPS